MKFARWKLLFCVLLGALPGAVRAEDSISKIQEMLKGPLPAWVQESDDYGGILIRAQHPDSATDAERTEFFTKVRKANETLPVFELHVYNTGERPLVAGSLSVVEKLPELRCLSLGGLSYDRADLKSLKHCAKLRYLGISGDYDKAATEQLVHAVAVQEIRAQHLRAHWASFPALPNLTELDLERSDFNNDGAVALGSCPKLARVFAYDTRIDDKGLAALAKVKKLEFLGISKGVITQDGIDEFRKLRPDVELMVNRPEPPRPAPPGIGQPLAIR